jgi:folate-binding protein YgfZ
MTSFFCILPEIQSVVVTGDKAATFLQGQLTCDVRDITLTQTRRGAYCTPKGRVLATCRVFQYRAHFYVSLPAEIAEPVIARLKKYAIFSAVDLAQDDAFAVIGCVGAEIGEALAVWFDGLPAEPDSAIFSKDVLLVRTQDAKKVPRFELIGRREAIDSLRAKLAEKYAEKASEIWQLSEIQAHIPTIYAHTSDLFTPQMLNYPALQGVSFKKGCYTGQEVIARTHYLGKAKRHLCLLQVENEELAVPGDPICDAAGQQVGTVVEAARQQKTQCLLLAVMQDAALEEGKKLYWKERGCVQA